MWKSVFLNFIDKTEKKESTGLLFSSEVSKPYALVYKL